MASPTDSTAPIIDTGKRSLRASVTGCSCVVAVGLLLYLPGINWGLPGTVSWSQDTIAGMRTIGAAPDWPADWKGRYPPLHYIVLHNAYRPILAHWASAGEYHYKSSSKTHDFTPPHAPKLGLLYLLARLITVAMAVATIGCIWWAARVLTKDDLAAAIAAIPLPLGAAFVYFAHLGNVDVASIAWLSLSVVFYVRAAASRATLDCLLLGLTACLAVATKDAVAGVYPGMALMLVIMDYRARDRGQSWSNRAAASLFRWPWLAGLIAFAFPLMYINGVFHNPDAFARRMSYWLDLTGDTLHGRQHRYPNQWLLLVATFWYAAGAVGWPMLVAFALSVVHTLRRHTMTAALLLTPAIGYYIIVVARIQFVYSRFLFPVFVFLSILTGIATADLLRSKRLPRAVRFSIPALVLLFTLGYSAAITLEMRADSRYAAERWLYLNTLPSTSIGAFAAFEEMQLRPQYLPRFHDIGYATYPVSMSVDSFGRAQPELLVLSSYNYEDFDQEQEACRQSLVSGELGYHVVQSFTGRYLGTGKSWLSLAGWGAPIPGKISPTLIMLRRDDN